MANAMSAKPHKMACGVVRFFICLSFACCGARIADLNDVEDRQESRPIRMFLLEQTKCLYRICKLDN